MSIDLTRFYESFFAESLDGLDTAEAGLLALEKVEPTPERLNAIFRGIHSLKGSAGSLGFNAITDFTHHVESVLDHLRKGTLTPDRDTLDVLLDCIDYSRTLVLAAREGKVADVEQANQLIASLKTLGIPVAGASVNIQSPPAVITSNRSGYHVRFEPSSGFFENGNDPLRLLRVLDGLGEMTAKVDLSRLPNSEEFDPERCYLAWDFQLLSDTEQSEVEEVFSWVVDDCKLLIETITPAAKEIEALAPQTIEALAPPPLVERSREDRRTSGRRTEDGDNTSEIRADRLNVSRSKVDNLINLVGELVITKTMLKQSVALLDPTSAATLSASLVQFERHMRDLQEGVMAIRMLPVSHAFGRFARMVRDVSQRLGKQVHLEISGEQSELDKSVIEQLVDPLTHLVRNSLDHGIESPEIRRALGKPETATLKLHAQHKAGNIEIMVSDDGRGIDLERVATKARAAGLLREDETLTPERTRELIFSAGFSTAEAVNELSGRGVGLDVVRKNISALSGSIKVESTPGHGTAFVIRLPLTLAIIDGMTVSVGADIYIVPMTFIVECLQTDRVKLKTVAGRGVLVEVRGKYLPLLTLANLTGATNAASFENGLLLILEAEGNRVALLVDALIDQDQVVIKSLENNYRKVPYLAGATILGQGKVVFILDVGALVFAVRE
ncbi:MAG: chemotaxis protein CheA [Pseudomonadota bacterium]